MTLFATTSQSAEFRNFLPDSYRLLCAEGYANIPRQNVMMITFSPTYLICKFVRDARDTSALGRT